MKMAVGLLAATMLMSSCVGSFTMFNKLAQWNRHATKYKLLNEIIFLVISPAYAFCGLADVLVLNSIEFWTGDNPMASNIGKTKMVKGEDGLLYAVKYLKDGYEITKPDGKVFYFTHDKETDTWSMISDGQEKKLLKIHENGTIDAYLNNEEAINITPDAMGIFQLRQAVATDTYWAMR